MSDYLPSFIVEPVLRQARRFSARTPHSGDIHDPDTSAPTGPSTGYYDYLPNVQVPDFQRFYPSRFWSASSPPPSGPRDETVEGTWQTLARNIQLWANQINNIDVIPSPPLDPMPDHAIVEEDITLAFPSFVTTDLLQPSPMELDGHQHRTDSETSLNPAQELRYRSIAFADGVRAHAQSDPVANSSGTQSPSRREPAAITDNVDRYTRRNASGQLPEDDGMGQLRQRINAALAGPGTLAEKSKLVHGLMTENYRRSVTPPASRGKIPLRPADRPVTPLSMNSAQLAQPAFILSQADVTPTYAPPDVDEDGTVHSTRDLGCEHYKRNVKMQCATCGKWYTCRLCHDEIEDHVLPRRDTRYMLCMLCRTPQSVSQICRNCSAEAACYYCPICKLWNNDPEKSIYHCDDCGICRLGQGLGKDFFHCKTCAACMSIQAETTHKCIERSTRCDCPICGEYMFTSNRPVAFMKCGHSIHESCFVDWCNTSYKCPICSRSIANMESQFRRLDRHIEEQPMPEEYQDNRAYVFCNDCNSRGISRYHWLGLKCSICESYNTTQLELLGPEQTPLQIQEQNERAQELGVGEAGLTASQTHTPSNELTSPFSEGGPLRLSRPTTMHSDRAQSPISRGSPFLLPHSPTRSARSTTPVIVGSYFGTGQRQPEPERRGSYFSIFSAGQPTTPQSTENGSRSSMPPNDEEEEMDFWGGHSPRSHDADMEVAVAEEPDEEESSSSSEEAMTEDEEEDGADSDGMELLGHR